LSRRGRDGQIDVEQAGIFQDLLDGNVADLPVMVVLPRNNQCLDGLNRESGTAKAAGREKENRFPEDGVFHVI
jgi:hypothetical protein